MLLRDAQKDQHEWKTRQENGERIKARVHRLVALIELKRGVDGVGSKLEVVVFQMAVQVRRNLPKHAGNGSR